MTYTKNSPQPVYLPQDHSISLKPPLLPAYPGTAGNNEFVQTTIDLLASNPRPKYVSGAVRVRPYGSNRNVTKSPYRRTQM
jgi:hypothetical protein